MLNTIHTDVLKFIESIIFINSVIFECLLNFIFIIKLFLNKNIIYFCENLRLYTTSTVLSYANRQSALQWLIKWSHVRGCPAT